MGVIGLHHYAWSKREWPMIADERESLRCPRGVPQMNPRLANKAGILPRKVLGSGT